MRELYSNQSPSIRACKISSFHRSGFSKCWKLGLNPDRSLTALNKQPSSTLRFSFLSHLIPKTTALSEKLLLSPFSIWGNWSLERLTENSLVIQLEKQQRQYWTHIYLLQKCLFPHFIPLEAGDFQLEVSSL